MLSRFNSYFQTHPDFWQFLKQHPQWLEELMLCPDCFDLLKLKYKEQRNHQWITKIQNMSMLLRMMGMTNG